MSGDYTKNTIGPRCHAATKVSSVPEKCPQTKAIQIKGLSLPKLLHFFLKVKFQNLLMGFRIL